MKLLTLIAIGGALLLPTGCARGPSGTTATANPGQLILVTLTVRGQIDPTSDYYFVLFNLNNTERNGYMGPVPVVTDYERGGNGFAGGSFSSYVEVHQNAGPPTSSSTDFGFYTISPDLLTPSAPAGLIQAQLTTTHATNDTLTFEIPLSMLATSGVSASDISNIEINFVATDNVPVSPEDTTPKNFDSLGDAITGLSGTSDDTIYVGTNVAGTDAVDDVSSYTPATTNTGSLPYTVDADQNGPGIANLDITNWSVTFTQ